MDSGQYPLWTLAAAVAALLVGDASRAAVPPDREVRAMLARRVDVQRQAVGIIVGIVTPAGVRYVRYGTVGVHDRRVPEPRTVFEIASVGKVFTAASRRHGREG